MRYDVTRFAGGVRLPGVCHLTEHFWEAASHAQRRRGYPHTQRPFDDLCCTLPSVVPGAPGCTCAPRCGIVEVPPHSSEHLHPLLRLAHILAGEPRYPSRRAYRTRASE